MERERLEWVPWLGEITHALWLGYRRVCSPLPSKIIAEQHCELLGNSCIIGGGSVPVGGTAN